MAGPRGWAELEVLPARAARFGPRDAEGRVDLITQQGTTVYRRTGR